MGKLITFFSVAILTLVVTIPTSASSDDECQTCTYQNCAALVWECGKLYGCPHTVACIGACSRLLVTDGIGWTPASEKAYNTCCDNCNWKNFPLQSRIKAGDVLICQSRSCYTQCS